MGEAFRELQRELEDINNYEKQKRAAAARFGGGPQSYYSPFGSGPGVGGMPIDGEAAKKWIEKAFDVASEFNGDFATTQKERDMNDEFLRKSRKWAEQILQSTTSTSTATDTNVDENETTDDSMKSTEAESTSSSSSSSPQSATEKTKTKISSGDSDEPAIEIPNLENTSDEDTFRVAIDLPGVEKDDVDVTVEDDFLIVRGTRYNNNRQNRNRRFTDAAAGINAEQEPPPSAVTPTPKSPMRKYEKKIAFVESEVEIDEMEAS